MNNFSTKQMISFLKSTYPDNCESIHECATQRDFFCKKHSYCKQYQIDNFGEILTKMENCSNCKKSKASDRLCNLIQKYNQFDRNSAFSEFPTLSNIHFDPDMDSISLPTYLIRQKDSFTQKILGQFRTCLNCNKNRKEFLKTCEKHQICVKCFNLLMEKECIPHSEICSDCCVFFLENITGKYSQIKIDVDLKQSTTLNPRIDRNIEKPIRYTSVVDSSSVCEFMQKSIKSVSQLKQETIESVFQLKQEAIESVMIMIPKCQVCKQQGTVYGFCCNHNLCLKCLCLRGYNEIIDHLNQVCHRGFEETQIFNYHCAVQGCSKIISLATSMILKFISRENIPQNNYFSERYISDHILLNIAFYDGIDDHLIVVSLY